QAGAGTETGHTPARLHDQQNNGDNERKDRSENNNRTPCALSWQTPILAWGRASAYQGLVRASMGHGAWAALQGRAGFAQIAGNRRLCRRRGGGMSPPVSREPANANA